MNSEKSIYFGKENGVRICSWKELTIACVFICVCTGATTDQPAEESPGESNQVMQPISPSDTLSPSQAWTLIERSVKFVDYLHSESYREDLTPAESFRTDCTISDPHRSEARALEKKAQAEERDIGLDIEARYSNKPFGAVGEEEFANGLSGAYIGAEWDILSGGFLNSIRRADLLNTQSHSERLRGTLAQVRRNEACRAREVRRKFDVVDDSLTQVRISLGRYHQRIVRQGYFNKRVGLERLLEVQAQLESARQRNRALTRHPSPPQLAFLHFPPLWNLDFAALRSASRGDSLRKALGRTSRQETRLENRLGQDTRLSVFTRYRLERFSQQGGLEVGIRASQPLSDLWSSSDAAEPDRLLASRKRQERDLQKQRSDLEEIQDQFESAQRGALRAHYQAMEVRERVRQQLVLHSRGAPSAQLNRALSQAQQLLDSTFEKIEAYREVYVLIGRAFRAARESFEPRFLQSRNVKSFRWRGRSGERGIYVWSESIRENSVSHILNLAEAQDLKRLIVSAGREADPQKRSRLMRLSRREDLKTEVLLGVNRWVTSGGVRRARQRISGLENTTDVLHLDVEPHALSDFNSNRKTYLKRYLDVLKAANEANPGDSLAVSIPLLGVWPKWIYQKMRPLVDQVYLMAYGETSPRKRARRALETARFFQTEKRTVSLRASDFSNDWELEKSVTAVLAVVDTDRIALHDFQSFSELIEPDE